MQRDSNCIQWWCNVSGLPTGTQLGAGDKSALLMLVMNGSFCLLICVFIFLTLCETAGFGQMMGALQILAGMMTTT